MPDQLDSGSLAADHTGETESSSPSRRSVLRGAAGAGAAGLAVTALGGFVHRRPPRPPPRPTPPTRPTKSSRRRRVDRRARPRRRLRRHRHLPRHHRDQRARPRPGRPDRPRQPVAALPATSEPLIPIQQLERQLMSSHREAPEISMDPVADSTDLYAFVSPDHPDTVTLIANYIPLQSAAGGPNFYEFGEDVQVQHPHRHQGPRRGQHHLRVPVHHHGRQPEHVPVQHRPDHVAERPELEPQAALLGHPLGPSRQARSSATYSARTWPARRATSARCPRRTTPTRWPSRPCTR